MSEERKPVVTSPGVLKQIIQTLRLAWRVLNDSRISLFPKLIPAAALVYVVSPIDLIPDFILGLGQIDDIGIVVLGIALFIEMCPRAIVDAHRAALDAELDAPPKEEDVIDGSYRVMDDKDSRKP